MKIAGVVILFYPDNKLLQRLNTYKHFLSKIYIVDNSDLSGMEPQSLTDFHPNVKYIFSGKNEGIAKRLNETARMAIDDGYEWLLTMDQDSSFNNGEFEKYVSCISHYKTIKHVAMFGVEYDKKKFIAADNCNFIHVNHLITSGSLVNLGLYNSTIGFDENLFIDQVDHEYCFQARLKGFEVVKLNNILLNHTLGSISTHRSLKNFKNTPRTLHSALRIYYMIRNYLYVKEKYFNEFSFELNEIRQSLLNSIKNNLLYNPKRFSVIKYMFLAYIHFKRGRMGKY